MRFHPILQQASEAGMRLGIDRFHSYISYVGNPIAHFPVIHVAGTNGKGSIVRMLESCLHQAGYRVGAYTSPHLQEINERIQVGKQNIPDAELDFLLRDLYKKAQAWMSTEYQIQDEIPLTHFELLTAAALQYFSNEKVDIAIIEVGLGGRHDATNILVPQLSIIASISQDHTELLGTDDASIAAEKAGIIKDNVPVLAGALSQEALRTIRMVAQEKSAALYSLGNEIRVSSSQEGVDVQFLERIHSKYPVPLLGSHQHENVAIAICALQILSEYFPISQEDKREGLSQVHYPGRMQWVDKDVLVDCAHNEAGARMLGAYLMGLPADKKRILVFGVSQEKDVRSIILSLAPYVDMIFTIAAKHPRAVSAQELSDLCTDLRIESIPSESFQDIHESIHMHNAQVIVSGSIFLVGAYLNWRESIGL